VTSPPLSSTSLSAGCRLTCADLRARHLVESWLAESRLPWPGLFDLEVTVLPQLPLFTDSREAFQQPTVSVRAGPPQGTVRIEWSIAPAMALVHPTEPRAEILLTPAVLDEFEAAERTFLLVTLLFVLRRLGWYHVHGAAVTDPGGLGWMLIGNSGTGKSTTAALLASRGWRVSTDDIGFLIDREGLVEVVGYRSPVALREGGLDYLGREGGLDLARRRKQGFWPEELGGEWASRVVPRYLLFSHLGDRTEGTLLAPVEAVSELVKWSMWILFEPLHAQEHLDLLARLVAQSRCYDVTLGPDLFRDPTLLQAIVHDDPIPPAS